MARRGIVSFLTQWAPPPPGEGGGGGGGVGRHGSARDRFVSDAVGPSPPGRWGVGDVGAGPRRAGPRRGADRAARRRRRALLRVRAPLPREARTPRHLQGPLQ